MCDERPASPDRSMTPKQDRFWREYLVDLNGTQAAIRAGYSARTARYIAAENMRKPAIVAALGQAMKQRGERLQATADDVVLEITRLAMLDPAELTSVKNPGHIKTLPEDVRRAIVGWSWDRQGNFVIKLAKEKALEMLGRHHGLFTDKVEHSGKLEITGLAERMRSRERLREARSAEGKPTPAEPAATTPDQDPGTQGLAERMRQRTKQP